ncbi:hypothetical protein I350_08076 [Cryptococcus amylolentus CBS 6273]|uniref:Homeobox domain-containing protein n=1 Tax=Cryptococcus amylolentus CBS 6273 TaxID=1296118 RepID=A0A1E3JAF0_9TREE|nr:hypothetical protein I350_08076 [Cryptococcus amylolentus CBS 6273]
MPNGGRRLSPDSKNAHNASQSTPLSPISSQAQAAHTQWRESRTSSSQSHSSSSSAHYQHPSQQSHYHHSRPPSSSSSSGSAVGYESRYGPPQLAPPPLAPYVTSNRRFFAPPPAQEQWLGPDGRRLTSQDPRPAFPPLQRPPPEHILTASSSRLTLSIPPPVQPTSYSHPYPPPAPSSAEESTQRPVLPGGHALTSKHSSMVSTHDHNPLHPSSSTVVRAKGHMEVPGKESFPLVTGWQEPSFSPNKLPMRSRSRSSSSADSGSTSRGGSQRSFRDEGARRASRTSSTSSQVEEYRQTSGNTSREGSVRAASVGVEHRRGKKKRTRALMTHAQQAGLMNMWKQASPTKFPTSGDREVLGQQIGLTARQVQVWFQNQRQKGRKTLLVNGGVPDGEDPADYEDLQKSPRSRRLSVEKDERISAWAGNSAGGAWPVADGHATEAATPSYGAGYTYFPPATGEHQFRHVPPNTKPFPVPPHTHPSAPLPPTSALSWSPSSQYPSVLEPPRSSNSLPNGDMTYAPAPLPSRSGFVDPNSASSSRGGYHSYEQYSRGYNVHPPVQGGHSPAYIHEASHRRSISEDQHPSPSTLPPPPSSFSLAPFGSGLGPPPPPILSAPITTPSLSQSNRQRADTRSSVQSVPSSSSTTSTPASTSHLPPSLARIAIAGPVAGGDDLPSLLPGLVGDRKDEEVGSPRKRNASWTLPERRVKGRAQEEEEGPSSGVRKLLE